MIDARAPRFNQAVVGAVALLGAIFGWPLAWAVLSVQLVIGLTIGRRFCLTCLAYFALVQPRFGEGPLEDARPPRLANMLGAAFLGAAAASWWLGGTAIATTLGVLVAVLALTAAATGFCAGCEVYRLTARLRGISPQHHARLDPADLAGLDGHTRAYVEFTHPSAATVGSGRSGFAVSRCSPWTCATGRISRASTGSRLCPRSLLWHPTAR